MVYGDGETVEYDDLDAARAAAGTTWVHVTAATPDEQAAVADAFDIHALAVEDIHNQVRAKTEEYPGHTFILVKTVTLARGDTTFEGEIEADPVGIFLGDGWVVTLSTGTAEPIERVRQSVVSGDERLLHRGPDFTAYRIIDVVIDEYFDVIDRLEDDIESIEEEVIGNPTQQTLEELNSVRRELLSFRKQLWPAREAVGYLARGDPPQISQETEKYFRDVYDHIVQLVDLTETYRDLVSGARDIYLNALSQSTNEVMKILTVVATIFIPLTFVAGVYGMNFDPSTGPVAMPELNWSLGYPAAMLGMLLIALIMVVHFRRREYL